MTVEARQHGIITRVTNENKRLRERVKYLEEENARKDRIIESLLLRIEELEKIIFGKKKNKDDNDRFFGGSNNKEPKERIKRDSSSYRRTIPLESEITDEKKYTIDTCPDCGSFLVRKRFVTRYVENILLPYLDKSTGIIHIPISEL